MAKKVKVVEEEKRDWSWHMGHKQSWVPGVVLIILGVIFLLRNFFPIFELHNWWALFILIPAVSNLSQALERYQEEKQFNRSVRSHLFWGVFFLFLSATFLLGVSISLIWPVFLIIGGLSILLGGL